MSSIICLWKYNNYLKDVAGGVLDETPAFNSHQSRLHDATEIGDTAYVLTYINGHCYLVGRIKITEKYFNPPNYEYGQFGIRGDPEESQYYECGSIDVTEVLRRLEFKTGKRIADSPRPLSQHLQTIRELTEDDVALLESCIPGPR